jgi:hypothetical protein
MNCPVCGRLEYDCECEPSEPIPEIGGEDEADMSWFGRAKVGSFLDWAQGLLDRR